MKHISHRKHARRRYKRLMAALAGAAVVTSAMLPGIPIARVHAAENTAVTAPATVAEVPAAAPATEPTAVETPSVAQVAEPAAKSPAETPAAEPAATAQPATEQTGDQKQSGQEERTQENRNQENRNQDRQQDRHNDEQNNAAGSPVAAVKAAAAVYGFDARNDKFSLQSQNSNEAVVLVRTDSGKTFKVHLSQNHGNWRVDSVKEVVTGGGGGVIRTGDPVDVVKDNAAIFGFNAAKDRFTLLSVNGGTAVVQVKTSGQTFKVDLERNGGKWVITTIRGIGNERYPATYRPASMFGYSTLGIATGPVATEKTLYSNDSFVNWSWQESAYPADMKLGVLVSPPAATQTSIPGVIVDKVDSIDFGRQLVLYAHIGSVADRGYGIGIERVAQTGNDLTVTVRIKSPLANNDWSLTKTNDVIPIDRLALNFTYPIHINFVDQDGVSLSSYTLQTK
jgi:hypothetical protein